MSKWIKLLILLLLPQAAEAAVYLQGHVTLNDQAYTSTASIYLSCRTSNWSSYASDWAQTDSAGAYSMNSSEDSWNPCTSTYANTQWSQCDLYAYPSWDASSVAPSEYTSVTLDCSQVAEEDLALQSKNKSISVSLTDGTHAITTGMSVSCWESSPPYVSGYTAEATDEVYNVSVTTGSYSCSAYCDWNYWYQRDEGCPYSGYPQTTVTVGESDSTVTASPLQFTHKDKNIRISVTAGGEAVDEGLTVSCSQQSSPWTYGSDSSADKDGTYNIWVTTGTFYCSSYCNTWPCLYSGYPSTYVTVHDSDTTVDGSLAYTVKNKTARVSLSAGSNSITSGATVYCSEQGGAYDYATDSDSDSDGIYTLSLGASTYWCSAYCSNYGSCTFSGYPRALVTIDSEDSAVDVGLTFLENDSTISGVVTDGSSGVANVWVSVNAYQIGGSSTGGLSALVTKQSTVTDQSDYSHVYLSVQTDSNGAFQILVPDGIYTVSVYPPWDRSDLTATSEEVTAQSSQTTVVSLEMARKTATIQGCVTDSAGSGVTAYVSGSSYSASSTTGDYFWKETDSDGCYSVSAAEGRTYNVSVSINTWSDPSTTYCNYSLEGMQAVTASSETQTVNFTIPTCDCQMTVQAVDSSDAIVSSVYGSVDATPTSFTSSQYYYGIWGYLSGGTGTLKVQDGVEYAFNGWFYSTDYIMGDEVTGTCSDGVGLVSITVDPIITNAVSGSYVDSEGNAVDVGSISYISVYASKGRNYRSCTASADGYQCDLSVGDWTLGYWIDPASGYASSSAGNSSSAVTITASGGVTQNMVLLRTGTIQTTVLNLDGSGRPNTSVQCSPFSSAQEGSNGYQREFGSGWCQTDSTGVCTMGVGASSAGTIYYCNAYLPYSMKMEESLNNPTEAQVTVVAGETQAVSLSYSQPDGSSHITVTEGDLAVSALIVGTARNVHGAPLLKAVTDSSDTASSPSALATVDCFSTAGGSYEVTADENGSATCLCSTGDTWYAVAHKIVGNAFYMSEATLITCATEGSGDESGVGSLEVDFVTTVPERKSMTVTDASTQAVTIELSDGFSVFFPPGSLSADVENVTVDVDITITPFTANRMPASFYAYSVSAYDENQVAITRLNSNATFTVPFDADQVENMGLTDSEIEICYFNDSEGAYTPISTAALDTSSRTISFTQDHLTDYAVVGNGYLGAVQGEDGGPLGDDPGGGVGASGGCGGCYALGRHGGRGVQGADWDDRILWMTSLILFGLWRTRNKSKKVFIKHQDR